ncbi:ComEC/Rec2 family competence protein [Rufibacter glacialis]|uniref:ComEC/Rec2 family competence protein n=1 Tax=Rufibacter glacialis TaxID=1259555 RepID=A0A5M8QJ71_9BACT|nr:MBL fold metallo-hydrolase [Rufibacter glacialis]KAA6434793.1 MBL fold metallo-hydrolase [Rufibacter glacialis]GGK72493.1 hypothetical protein GCM10011405_20900 [Rufibacter glacialis]
MTGTIQLLDVGDGDAILVHLHKEGKDLVLVIDGGQERHYEQVVKPALSKLLQELNKIAPDIIVATHYDSDHIGGLIPLVQDYLLGIKEVWVHRSPELGPEDGQILASSDKKARLKHLGLERLEESLARETYTGHLETITSKSALLIESLKQLDTFLGLLPATMVRQVFHGDSYPGWPEIKVLGPEKGYYQKLFPACTSLQDLVVAETRDFLTATPGAVEVKEKTNPNPVQDPCLRLKDDSRVSLTATNKASIIIALDKGDQRFLFTGDAGIPSFKAIPAWEKELKDLYWLKVPHHGSDNNISKELIDLMRPEYADSSGDRHQDQHVLDCIARNTVDKSVRSTKTSGCLIFPI